MEARQSHGGGRTDSRGWRSTLWTAGEEPPARGGSLGSGTSRDLLAQGLCDSVYLLLRNHGWVNALFVSPCQWGQGEALQEYGTLVHS